MIEILRQCDLHTCHENIGEAFLPVIISRLHEAISGYCTRNPLSNTRALRNIRDDSSLDSDSQPLVRGSTGVVVLAILEIDFDSSSTLYRMMSVMLTTRGYGPIGSEPLFKPFDREYIEVKRRAVYHMRENAS